MGNVCGHREFGDQPEHGDNAEHSIVDRLLQVAEGEFDERNGERDGSGDSVWLQAPLNASPFYFFLPFAD